MKTQFLSLFANNKVNKRLLKWLLIIDIIFILGHLTLEYSNNSHKFLMVDSDGSLPEIFQYLKFLTLIILTSMLISRKRKLVYFPWLFLFVLMLFDDALQLHERFGRFFAALFKLNDLYGLRSVDFGELIYASLVGVIFFVSLLFSYFKASELERRNFRDILILFLIFIFFGVGMDMLHQLSGGTSTLSVILAIVEDGGEMLSISIIVWYFFNITYSKDVTPVSI